MPLWANIMAAMGKLPEAPNALEDECMLNRIFNKRREIMSEEKIEISKKNWQSAFASACDEAKALMEKLIPGECEEEIELKSGQIYRIDYPPCEHGYRLLLKVDKAWTTIILEVDSFGDYGLYKYSEKEMKKAMDYVGYVLCPNARLKVIEE